MNWPLLTFFCFITKIQLQNNLIDPRTIAANEFLRAPRVRITV